jgi:MraZ protein
MNTHERGSSVAAPDAAPDRKGVSTMAELAKAKAFISTTTVKVDSKGRVSVPAVLRNLLIEKGMQEVVAFPNFKLPCIECCDWDRINAITDAADGMDLFSDEADDISSLIFAAAQPLPWDTTGRISLPEPFLAHAGISDAAVFVGKGRTFQIWRPEDFHARQAEQLRRAREKGLSLTLRRKPEDA